MDQTDSFELSEENRARADVVIAKYPADRAQSAVMPLLDIAQRQAGGWLPRGAVIHVAEILGMAEIRVWEVASFYTMYNLEPVGRTCVNVCTTTPCWLRGSADIVDACEQELGIKLGETDEAGDFTLREVECLGACVNAPMAQIGDDFYEDLTPENTVALLQAIKNGDKPEPGPQSARQGSEPLSGAKTLKGDA